RGTRGGGRGSHRRTRGRQRSRPHRVRRPPAALLQRWLRRTRPDRAGDRDAGARAPDRHVRLHHGRLVLIGPPAAGFQHEAGGSTMGLTRNCCMICVFATIRGSTRRESSRSSGTQREIAAVVRYALEGSSTPACTVVAIQPMHDWNSPASIAYPLRCTDSSSFWSAARELRVFSVSAGNGLAVLAMPDGCEASNALPTAAACAGTLPPICPTPAASCRPEPNLSQNTTSVPLRNARCTNCPVRRCSRCSAGRAER